MLLHPYIAFCILNFPHGGAAHPALGLAIGLGAGGPLFLVGMAVVVIGTIVGTAMVIDRSQTTPRRRPSLRPSIRNEPPDPGDISQDEEEDAADAPSTPVATKVVPQIPFSQILPGGSDLDIASVEPPRCAPGPGSTPRTDLTNPFSTQKSASSRTSEDDTSTVVPDDRDRDIVEASSQPRDIMFPKAPLGRSFELKGVGSNMVGMDNSIPTEVSMPRIPIYRVKSDEIVTGSVGSITPRDADEESAGSGRSKASSTASPRSWSGDSLGSVGSSVEERTRETMRLARSEAFNRTPRQADSGSQDAFVEHRSELTAKLAQNLHSIERTIEGHVPLVEDMAMAVA